MVRIFNVTEVPDRQTLCAKHFNEEDVLESKLKKEARRTKYRLKRGAVPHLCPEAPK